MAIDEVCAMLESWHLQHAPRPDSVPDSIFAPLSDAASA
jgi:hypothetical protein